MKYTNKKEKAKSQKPLFYDIINLSTMTYYDVTSLSTMTSLILRH